MNGNGFCDDDEDTNGSGHCSEFDCGDCPTIVPAVPIAEQDLSRKECFIVSEVGIYTLCTEVVISCRSPFRDTRRDTITHCETIEVGGLL